MTLLFRALFGFAIRSKSLNLSNPNNVPPKHCYRGYYYYNIETAIKQCVSMIMSFLSTQQTKMGIYLFIYFFFFEKLIYQTCLSGCFWPKNVINIVIESLPHKTLHGPYWCRWVVKHHSCHIKHGSSYTIIARKVVKYLYSLS